MPSKDIFKNALAAHQSGDIEAAENLYKELLEKSPEDADILHLLSILMAQKEEFEIARQYIDKALKLQPNSASFHNTLGNIEKNLGRTEQAIEQYQRAIHLAPHSAAAHNNLGTLLYKQNKIDEAIAHYRHAIQLQHDYADAHYNLAHALTLKNQYDEAIEHIKVTLKYQPNHPQAHGLLGQLYFQKNNIDEAILHYKKRLELDPDHAETHHQLAVAYTQLDQLNDAMRHYQETLKLQPDHLEALHNFGALSIMQRQMNQALKSYLRLLQLQPDLDTFYNLGVIYMYQERHEDAIQYFNQAAALKPDFINTHVNLAAIYLKKENYPMAIQHYQAAQKLQPENTEINYILTALQQNKTLTSVPKEYVKNLFDQYAVTFDRHLLEHLNYRVPQLLYDAVNDALSQNEKKDNIVVLDLGCGTGLCGEKFRSMAKTLIGVDLSPQMIEVAKKKHIYDELRIMDIHPALKEIKQVDIILAGDVLGYIGDLNELFSLTKNALNPNGLFAFTIEKTFKEPYELQKNARFAHSKTYIERLAEENHFNVLSYQNVILRSQKKIPVEGYLFVLALN